MTNDLYCCFSNLKVIPDIDFFCAGLLFIFICISTFEQRLFSRVDLGEGCTGVRTPVGLGCEKSVLL